MAAQFVDISEWQPENIDWQSYKSWSAQWDGISRVAIRSSYGNGNIDKHFLANRANALNAGIDQIFYYHYAYPQFNSASQEANWQRQVVGNIRPQDMIILDFEENVPEATGQWALTWLQVDQGIYAKKPGIYASSAYIQERLQIADLANFSLWLANWQYTPDERPPCPPPWTSYEFVQYTNKASIPGIPGVVDADIFLGGTTPMPTTTIDLTNPTVASHFTGGPDVWQCTDNKFFIGYAILDFYKQFGGNALCGLTYLGLPTSNEMADPNHQGVVIQKFERGCLRYDPQKLVDNPPGSGPVYLIHVEQDPRSIASQAQIATLQAEITKLQSLPVVANMQQIQTIGQRIQSDVATIMQLAQVQ